MDRPPKTDQQTSGFIDASEKLHSHIYAPLHEEIGRLEEFANDLGDEVDGYHPWALMTEMNQKFFDESNGNIRRVATISGPAYKSEKVLSVEEPAFTELSIENGLLHGMTFVEITDADGSHFQAAFIAEDIDTHEVYFFPFWTTDTLEYAPISQIADTLHAAMKSMETGVDVLKSVAWTASTPEGRMDMLQAASDRAERAVLHLEFDDDSEGYEIEAKFFYVVPDEIQKNDIDLNVFNIDTANHEGEDHRYTLYGAFSGVTFPALEQPNLIRDDGTPVSNIAIDPFYAGTEVFDQTAIDPFEPCLKFYDEEYACTYLIPQSQLIDVY